MPCWSDHCHSLATQTTISRFTFTPVSGSLLQLLLQGYHISNKHRPYFKGQNQSSLWSGVQLSVRLIILLICFTYVAYMYFGPVSLVDNCGHNSPTSISILGCEHLMTISPAKACLMEMREASWMMLETMLLPEHELVLNNFYFMETTTYKSESKPSPVNLQPCNLKLWLEFCG